LRNRDWLVKILEKNRTLAEQVIRELKEKNHKFERMIKDVANNTKTVSTREFVKELVKHDNKSKLNELWQEGYI